MNTQALGGKTALVTGASSGLGVDFARELAAAGADLILVARREELLQRLQAELRDAHGGKVDIICCDLAHADNRQKLHDDLQAAGRQVDVLINNAGFGLFGDFHEVPWERTDQMLQLDIVALSHLTRLFLSDMVMRGDGHIMLIGSTGSFQPSPGYAAYAAAKAYVLSFGHALHFELRKTGVSCTVVCPGVTATEFLEVSGQKKTFYQKATMMDSATVARMGVRRMLARKPEIVTGWVNAINAFQMRFLPRPLAAWLAWYFMRND